MLKGNLFYKEKKNTWVLMTSSGDKKVNTLIHGLQEVGILFDGRGEYIELSIDTKPISYRPVNNPIH